MYEITVGHITKKQFNNLLKGKGVRVSRGNIHSFIVDRKLYNKFNRNASSGKLTTLKKGAGLLSDIYKYIQERPMLRQIANRAIKSGKVAAHYGINKGVDYANRGIARASEYAHRKVRDFPLFEGEGMRRRRRGKGLGGMALSLGGLLANAIGGPGSKEAADILGGLGGAANMVGLGMKPRRVRRGKGLLGTVLSGSGELAGLIGGQGSDDAKRWLGSLGGMANIIGLGMKKQKKRATPAQLVALAKGRAKRQQNLYGGFGLRPAGY